MNDKDLRRFAIGKWRKNWPTMLVAILLQFSVYIAVVICFSFVFSPFLASTMISQTEGLRRGIGLTVSGIMLALLVFILVIYLIVSSFSFIYMALKLVRGEKISPFDVFYTLQPKIFPMQVQLLVYSIFYAFFPWLLTFLFYFFFKSADPILNFVEEIIFNIFISLFLLFFLCTPFLILEKKARTLGAAMKKSIKMMRHEKHRFIRHLLYFMGIRVIMNILASMWSFSLDDSILPEILLGIFLYFYLTPCFILVQAGFYQQIVNKEKKAAETAKAFVASFSSEEREGDDTQNESIVVEVSEKRKEEDAESKIEESDIETTKEAIEKNPESKLEGVAVQTVEERTVKKEDTTESNSVKDAEDVTESNSVKDAEDVTESNFVEDAAEEEKNEKLSFEEARKRYTDYKEES